VVGVISINKLLVQKTEFTPTDFELFTLLAGHAATAIFSAKLYSTSRAEAHDASRSPDRALRMGPCDSV
jgi:GAF domain-containing protein